MKFILRSLLLLLSLLPMVSMAAEDVPYLLAASARGDVAMVRAILDSGASANTKDSEGITALMYAARKGNAEVAQVLLEKGADVNAKDGDG
jgi:ankyrin repeat protein